MPNPESNRLPFIPHAKYVVTKQMRLGSRTWEIGENFPIDRLSIDQRRLRVLYDGKFISMKGTDAQPDEPEEETPAEELVAGEGEFVYDPEVHNIEHEDNEYWVADEEAYLVRVRAPMGKKLDTATEKMLITEDDILAWGEED